ncbi:ornithine carbamoyltransferase [Fibrobacterota bacterium]
MSSGSVKNLISLLDFNSEIISAILKTAIDVKKEYKKNGPINMLQGRTLVLIFEKQSLRTRMTFEVAMAQLGGTAINLEPEQISLGERESVQDAAVNLSLWVDMIVARTFKHDLVVKLAEYASVPVINALTDLFHPCQALAFAQTILETTGKLPGAHLVFVGDGNNVANSLALLSGLSGMDFTLACPPGYEQPVFLQKLLNPIFERSGRKYRIEHNPMKAVSTADVIYTDVWVSMGQEEESEKKTKDFLNYQVNGALMSKAPKGCLVSHCLPAHRGEEIVDEVMDSDVCICFKEAENRLHVQKAVLLYLLKPDTFIS